MSPKRAENRKARRIRAAWDRRHGRRELVMSEQVNGQEVAQQAAPATAGQVPAQWEAFVRGVQRLSAECGLQAVVVSAVVPAMGGFGPSSVQALSWVLGQAPVEFREGASKALADVSAKAAAAMVPADASPAPVAEA